MVHAIVRHMMLNFIIGASYLFLQIMVFLYIGGALHYEVKGSLLDLFTAIGTQNPILATMSIVGLLVTGFLIYIMAWEKHIIAPHLGLSKTSAPTFGKEKLPAIMITLIGLGIVAQFIFIGFNQIAQSLNPTTDVATVHSFIAAIASLNPIMIGITYLSIVVFGGLILGVGEMIKTIENKLPL